MTIEVHTVDTLAQASAVLTGSARYFGGGTLLMRQINYGQQSFDRLVVSTDPTLKQISVSGEQITIGAGVTMADVLRHNDLAFMADVARSVGGPAIRNMATVGGNLFAPLPYGDFATALLALNANVQWTDGQQSPVEHLFEQPAESPASRIVSSVSFRRPASGTFRYLKVSRVKPKGVSVMTIAAVLNRENGRVGDTSIAFGGMAPRPRRATSAETALRGSSLDEAGIDRCCAACTDGMAPTDDALASAWYRNEVAPVYLKRLLQQRSEY
ncbi:MAG: FAD binding domain-containing protein [Pseudomonadota bacterium]